MSSFNHKNTVYNKNMKVCCLAQIIPLLRRGGGGAAGVVFFGVCGKVTDHPVSRFATATTPKEGN